MKRVAVAAACLAFAVSACGDTTKSDTMVPVGNSAAFCSRWPEARSAILTDFDSSDDADYKRAIAGYTGTLDDAEALVPAEVRSLWDTATGFRRMVLQLVDIAGNPGAVRAELIQAAFPGGNPDAAEQAALDAVAALDEWSIAQCGDFCQLWPRLDRALAWNFSAEHGGGPDWPLLSASGADEAALLQLADPLVPPRIRALWDEVAGIKLALVNLWLEVADLQDGGQEFNQRVGSLVDTNRLWDRLMAPSTGEGLEQAAERLGIENWMMGAYIEETVRGEMASWVESNCDTVGTSGLPGIITVQTRETGGVAEGTLLVVALPAGTDIRTTESARDYLGATCFDGYPSAPGSRSAFLLDREDDFRQPCAWLEGWGHGGPTQAVVDAGTYDLFFGLFTRGVGSYDDYLAAPETCATVQVVVDGDIDVEVPSLEPCEMQYLAGTPEEYARRNPPDPAGVTGTLRLIVSGVEAPGEDGEFRHGGSVRAAVVPAGTSLNEIGRGEVWPAGAGCLGLPGADQLRELTDNADRFLQDFEAGVAEAERRERDAAEQAARADQMARDAEQTLEEADRMRAESDSVTQQADAGGDDEPRLRAEAERLWGEAEGMEEEAHQLAREADQAREQADQMFEEADRIRQDTEQMSRDAEHVRQQLRALEEGVELVIAEFPEVAEWFGRACPGFFEVAEGSTANMEPVGLPYGTYDVYIEQSWFGDDTEWQGCAHITVEIDGDVVVAVPEMGECP